MLLSSFMGVVGNTILNTKGNTGLPLVSVFKKIQVSPDCYSFMGHIKL